MCDIFWKNIWTNKNSKTRSQSFKTLISSFFRFLFLSLSVCRTGKYCLYIKMSKHNSKKRKKICVLRRKKFGRIDSRTKKLLEDSQNRELTVSVSNFNDWLNFFFAPSLIVKNSLDQKCLKTWYSLFTISWKFFFSIFTSKLWQICTLQVSDIVFFYFLWKL